MNTIAEIASKIRHSRLLEKADWMWNLLRKPYHSLLNAGNKGVLVKLDNHFSYRIPPQYYYVGLENYERDNITRLVNWIKANPDCYVLDIGCSLGFMSAISLFASAAARVISFDSDLSSLQATLNMCSYAPSKNISLVYGLVAEKATNTNGLQEAVENTRKLVKDSGLSGAPGTTVYANLDTADESTPIYAIDTLFESATIDRPVLLKCDIEGAELFALKGAKVFIAEQRPVMLLSIHPDILPVFGCTVQQVRDFLAEMRYSNTLISIDHEEHWWCEPMAL